ncbi:hypothetical protein GQ53DRAFT_873055 [Thozetella sp. PMI_491]|nr:hypothetical protein GQ53DRAFT_873055 [Thozetella sp. PMI_491]
MDDEPKVFPVNLKDGGHIFSPGVVFRWKNPQHYKLPAYKVASDQTYRHCDWAGRVKIGPHEDRYIHPIDGRLRKLIVATTDDIFEAPGTTTWRRTYVRKTSPLAVRLATWVIDFSYDPKSWEDYMVMLLRTFPAALAMQFVFWTSNSPRSENNGNYSPLPYHYWGDAKVWSNNLENKNGTGRGGVTILARNNSVYRVLKPRHLCFLREQFDDELHGVDVRSVEEWEKTDGEGSTANYLFIAYSTEHFSHDSDEDKRALHHIAETAARAAKVPAYWVSVSCMQDPEQTESDVYRISDILRGAQGMIIAVGQSKGKAAMGTLSTDALLAQWGRRMWTFPEVLLSPGNQIPVYTRGGNLRAPLLVSKSQFAGRVWGELDAEESRQLVDHYVGNLGLSRLELAVTALKCLYLRQTTEYLAGDQAYALMGLLRLRPQIDRTDSPFQAFARLSLANDSDKLLERYLCTLPKTPSQPWHDMSDAYNSALWDIEPYIQIAGICDKDAIIIDGARGASIRWKTFYHVAFTTGPSFRRDMAITLMQNMTVVLVMSIVFFALGGSYVIVGLVFLCIYFWIFLKSPALIRRAYGGKFTDVQATFFGFEGYLNAPTVERAIFGGAFGRMGWSSNGSPLSLAKVNKFGEKYGIDPTQDPTVRMKVEQAKKAQPGQMRIFTLVDTYNMKMTLFEAVRPPVSLLACASEGGMQRVIGCSYDWTTQTMYRETVLRLPTDSMNKLCRVPRVRVGIQRPELPVVPTVPTAV